MQLAGHEKPSVFMHKGMRKTVLNSPVSQKRGEGTLKRGRHTNTSEPRVTSLVCPLHDSPNVSPMIKLFQYIRSWNFNCSLRSSRPLFSLLRGDSHFPQEKVGMLPNLLTADASSHTQVHSDFLRGFSMNTVYGTSSSLPQFSFVPLSSFGS